MIAECYHFHKRDQKDDESVKAYVSALNANLEDTLRDRLVCGIKDLMVQKRLLTKEDLTFSKAIDMDTGNTGSSQSPSKVGRRRRRRRRSSRIGTERRSQGCFRCGGNHQPHECWFQD